MTLAQDGLCFSVTQDEFAALIKLSRRLLWIAYCWDENRFEDSLAFARRDAAEVGLTNVDEANAFLSSLPEYHNNKPLVGGTELAELEAAFDKVRLAAKRVERVAEAKSPHNDNVNFLAEGLQRLSGAVVELSKVIPKD